MPVWAKSMELIDTQDCLECSRLREVYRCATRRELDLEVMCDQAAMRNDPVKLEELRAQLAEAVIVRASASKGVLDHEDSHHAEAIAAGA
jgi:hypothetical protein